MLMAPSASVSKETKAPKPQVEDELVLKVGDEKTNQLKNLKAELLISRSDEKAQKQLEKLLGKYKGTALEASLHFRKAELYGRRAKTANFFEMNRDNNQVVQFSPMATKSKKSQDWIRKAIETYDFIERKFVNYRDMDLVLFNNAFSRQLLGEDSGAVTRYLRIVQDFPESPLVADCHLAIGEAHFRAKKFQQAYDEFEKIRKFPEAQVYPYGIYKGAWALYNLRRAPDGLKQLEEVVAYYKDSDKQNNRLDLRREALLDMVVFFEDVKKPSEAVTYFRKQGGDEVAGELVLRLGHVYQRHGHFKNLEVVFTDLIGEIPLAPERPEMHRDLVEAFDVTKEKVKSVAQLEEISKICPEDSKWAQKQSLEKKGECWELLEATSRKYAVRWHKAYSRDPAPELGAVTRRAYEAILVHESKTFEESDKFRFSYAELLFQIKDFRAASPQYSKVALMTKDSKLRHDSSYASIVSLEKAVGDKWSDQDEREFSRLAAQYIQLNPKGQYVTDVRFKKAFIAYDKGRLDESKPELKALALQYSNNERGRKAAGLYLDILNLQKKFAELRDESKSFAKKLQVDEKSKAEFMKISQQAELTVIQNDEKAGRFKEAAQGYLNFQKEYPSTDYADKALYNAVRVLNNTGELSQAAEVSELLINKYPKSTYKNELAQALVTLYEAQANLGMAAKAHERMAEATPAKRQAHLLAAADFKALNNEWAAAREMYLNLQKKGGPESVIALERLAALAEKNKDKRQAEQLYRQLARSDFQPQASLASSRLSQWALERQDNKEAFEWAKDTIGMRSADKVSKKALAQARFVQGIILEQEFDQASVKVRNLERLSTVLAIKTERLEKAQSAFQGAVGYGDPTIAVESLRHLAACYKKFAAALKTVEAPSDAPEKDREKFSQEIQNLIFPIEEKYAETLQLALDQAKKLKLFDGQVALIQKELNDLTKRFSTQTVVKIEAPGHVVPLVN